MSETATMPSLLDRHHACDALYAAGYHLLERGRIDDAALLFRTMLLADAEDERAWLALGICHEQLEQNAMAQELYDAGAHTARSRVRCLVAVARLLRKLGDDRSEEALEAAMDLAATEEEEELVQFERKRRTA